MGWSSWSLIRNHPTEANIKAQADALIAAGLPAAGYRSINIDDGWSDGFDEHGVPKPNLTSFPDGMEGMAKYMHAHGLLFGIYLNPGIASKLYQQNPRIEGTIAHIADIADIMQAGSTRRNCYRIDFTKPAAAAYIRSQVEQFEKWGVDFVKFDFVGPGGGNVPADNREELRQWHVAIVHARSRAPAWSAWIAARRTGAHFVTTYHGAYGEDFALKRVLVLGVRAHRHDRLADQRHLLQYRLAEAGGVHRHVAPAEQLLTLDPDEVLELPDRQLGRGGVAGQEAHGHRVVADRR